MSSNVHKKNNYLQQSFSFWNEKDGKCKKRKEKNKKKERKKVSVGLLFFILFIFLTNRRKYKKNKHNIPDSRKHQNK